MVLLFRGSPIRGSKVVIIEEHTHVGGVGVGVRKTGTRGGAFDRWVVRGFSEPRSEACPYQNQGSLGDDFF